MILNNEDFIILRDFMYNNYGINLANKKTLIEGRLGTVIKRYGFDTFTDYVRHVTSNPDDDSVSLLVSRLTTNYTYFMREKQHFEFLEKTALPEFEQTIKDGDLRTWSAGCSSGEEPYSLAMLFDSYFSAKSRNWNTQVLATDISGKVLEIARNGVYDEDKLNEIPALWREKYFSKIGEQEYKVRQELRDQVAFGHFNLMSRVIPFKKKFHLIFCRNVMIYFDEQTRKALVDRYTSVLEPGGFLIVGLSETLSSMRTNLEMIKPSIYKKA